MDRFGQVRSVLNSDRFGQVPAELGPNLPEPVHKLVLARELIDRGGCAELELTASAAEFALTIRHGPFDDT